MSFAKRFESKTSKVPVQGLDIALREESQSTEKGHWMDYIKTFKDSDIRKKEDIIKFELMELDKKQRLILPKIKKNKLLKNYPNKSVKEINLLFTNLNKDLVDECEMTFKENLGVRKNLRNNVMGSVSKKTFRSIPNLNNVENSDINGNKNTDRRTPPSTTSNSNTGISLSENFSIVSPQDIVLQNELRGLNLMPLSGKYTKTNSTQGMESRKSVNDFKKGNPNFVSSKSFQTEKINISKTQLLEKTGEKNQNLKTQQSAIKHNLKYSFLPLKINAEQILNSNNISIPTDNLNSNLNQNNQTNSDSIKELDQNRFKKKNHRLPK